jgi:hypothetical protein
VRGIDSVYVGVRSFGPTVRSLRSGLGWSVVDVDVIEAADCRWLWGVDATAEVLTMAPGGLCPGGRIDLVRFPTLDLVPHGGPSMASWGYTAVSIYVRDIESSVAALRSHGARLAGGIVRGTIPRGDGVVVETAGARLVVEDLNVLLVQTDVPRATWAFSHGADAPSSEINFMLYRTTHLDELLRFWGSDGLGLPIAHSTPVGGEAVARSYGTAPGLHMDNAITGNLVTARLELQGPDLSRSDEPDDLRDRQRPGVSLGPVLWRTTLPELPESFAAWCEQRQLTARAPRRMASHHFGGRLVTTVEGPHSHQVQLEVVI